ncbi:hypothetical protein GE09DRAFT_1065879 [Coniochaeta sp. 2T2.1]|nr:hypothetical protein GE09DRAFT_1065879 [Coniochaeta sp. 2T2.1]
MSISSFLYPLNHLRELLDANQSEFNREIFQVIDTLSWCYLNEPYIPAARALPLDSDNADMPSIAIFIEGFMTSRDSDDWAEELATLDDLRPWEPRFPVLQLKETGFQGGFNQNVDHKTLAHVPNNQYMVCNLEHAMELDAQLHATNNKKGVTEGAQDCNDYPKTDAERRKMVHDLVAAMKNFKDIVEKPVACRRRKRAKRDDAEDNGDGAPVTEDNYRVQRIRNTNDQDLTLLAWRILKDIKNAQDGNIYMPHRYGKLAEYAWYPDFMTRYGHVLDGLKESKALVDDLMLWDPSHRIVANPEKELSRKKTNKSGNDKETDALKIGFKIVRENDKAKTAGKLKVSKAISQRKTSQPDTLHPDTFPPDSSHPDTFQLGALQTGAFEPHAFEPNTFQPGTVQPNAFQPGAYHPASQPGVFQPDIFQPDIFQPSALQPAAFNPNTFHPGAFQPDAVEPNTFQPGAFQPNTCQPEISTGKRKRASAADEEDDEVSNA